MTELRFGLIGCGHWGPNYARLLQAHPQANLCWAADLNQQSLDKIKRRFPDVQLTQNSDVLLQQDLDAVIIATPASSHFDLCQQAIAQGHHVLCEKPLTLNSQESQQLCEQAKQRQSQLMVGHTFLFNSGILALKQYLQEGLLGDMYYITSKRTNLGPIRQDVNAIADLASHDLSILNYLMDALPEAVSAQGQSFFAK